MREQNYFDAMAERVRAGDTEAAREFPKDLERHLRIMVRSALRRGTQASNVARVAHELARQFLADTGTGGATASATLAERVARSLALEVTARLRPACEHTAPALQTALA